MKHLLVFLFSALSFGQQLTKVDFIKCEASLSPNFESKSIVGTVSYDFKVISEIDSIRIDAKNMYFKMVLINGKQINYKNNKKELILFEGYKKGKNKVSFIYNATPKQTLYFTGVNMGQQIWTQGQGKYTSHWLPSFDDVNEKVVFNISVVFDKEFKTISNGILDSEAHYPPLSSKNKIWHYKMQKPMSSYLVMVAVGNFLHKAEKSQSGITLENYYKPMDRNKYNSTYKDSKIIFDFLENEIGVKYPWKIYRQIPVEDFLYAGMENTTSTIFAQDFVVDQYGFNDRNYINVNAHELAHQWFGNLVTAKSGKHHWLQEGFATYYALLAEKQIFGEDYFYNQLYNYSNRIKIAAKNDTIPILNEKASSLSFYQKGAWALHFIKESIGDKNFKKAVKNYIRKHQFKNVDTDDFLIEIKKVSNFDVLNFQKNWLEDYKHPSNDINFLLNKNAFIRDLLKLQSQRKTNLNNKYKLLETILTSNAYFPIKIEVIYQIQKLPFEQVAGLYHLAMKSNSIEVRKYIAETRTEIPISFKSDYESLLNDQSYQTKQAAFLNLWKNFPNDHAKYIELAKNWIGNNDRELRITFLTLYQNFEEANLTDKERYWNELLNYTSSQYESSIRQNALENVLLIDSKNETALKNLVNATIHHKWQFTKFARDKIRELIKDNFYITFFTDLMPTLPQNEQAQLQKIIVKN